MLRHAIVRVTKYNPAPRSWKQVRLYRTVLPEAGVCAYNASMARSQLLGTFEQLVLSAILQVGEDAYPPPVLEWLERNTGRAVNRGSFYVSLDRLERKGFLMSRADAVEDTRGGRPRRYLEVTADGVAALRSARDSLLASWKGIEPLLGDDA